MKGTVSVLFDIVARGAVPVLDWMEGRVPLADMVRLPDAVAGVPVFSVQECGTAYESVVKTGAKNLGRELLSPVFITARFRSGSTLLWRLFRETGECTAFYEPLNERRWFDPLARGERVDGTHRGVTDYWAEYAGMDALGRWFDPSWTFRRLFLGTRSFDPGLKRYIDTMLHASPKRPVLQFNRVDFRLGWLRKHYPGATIVHLFRNVRDVWRSTLFGEGVSRTYTWDDFCAQDRFYLVPWIQDLSYHFPFLTDASMTHPYQRFYLLWRLSYLFGRRYADLSVSYDELIRDPAGVIAVIGEECAIPLPDVKALAALVQRPVSCSSQSAEDDLWFDDMEAAAEAVFFGYWSRKAGG